MKLRLLAVLTLVAASVVALAAPLNYVVKVKGERAGSVVTETTGSAEDGFTDDTTIEMDQDGKKVNIRIVTKYDKTGTDLSKLMTISFEDNQLKVLAKLCDATADIKVTMGDAAPEDQEIKTATATQRADETYFWFKTITPAVGKKVTYQGFDIQEGEWRDVTHEYKGREKFKIGDTEFEGHKIIRTENEEENTVYLDDKGDLMLYIDGDTRIERVVAA